MPVPVIYHNQVAESRNCRNFRWWLEKEPEVYKAVLNVVSHIENKQTYRTNNFLKFLRIYQNERTLGLGDWSNVFPLMTGRMSLNVSASCIDTACAKISHTRPKPLILTKDGDYSLKKKAKARTKYLETLWDQNGTYFHGKEVFKDGCIFGTGCLHSFIQDDKICVERVPVKEILVDDHEGVYRKPRQMFRSKSVSRDVLLEMFADDKKAQKLIRDAEMESPDEQGVADQILVIEAWHLRSGKEASDGKHAIVINTGTLLFEDYEDDFFPFNFFSWKDAVFGFWGIGLCEELIDIQIEINKTIRNISRAIELMGVPRVLVERGSNVVKAHINNEIGGIITYNATPPQFVAPPVVQPEIYSYLENLFKKAFEISGISQMQASSKKEPGLESGAAIRTMADVASERFLNTGQRYEQFYMDVAKLHLQLAKKLYGEKKNLPITIKDRKFIKQMKWEDLSAKDEEFFLQMYPVSIMPTTPAGKLQTTQDLYQAGFIDQDTALSLLDFPDLENKLNLKLAAQANIENLIEQMLDEGKYEAPEKFMNLNLAIAMTQESLMKAKNDQVPEDRLDLLRNFIEDCEALLTANQPPAPVAEDPNAIPQQTAPQAAIME